MSIEVTYPRLDANPADVFSSKTMARLMEDCLGVFWRDKTGKRGTLFNFKTRRVAVPGKVVDITTGRTLPRARDYQLEACHTYAVAGDAMPVK